MKESEIQALLSLLDDTDNEIYFHVFDKILSLGNNLIPVLEKEWEKNLNPLVQERIENIIHKLQVDNRVTKFVEWKNSEDQDLIEGLWLICTVQYPDYELLDLKTELEQLFYTVWLDYDQEAKGRDAVAYLNNILFSKLKFAANTKNFHSPENSILKSVISSRKGNPISLGMVYLLMARKLKLPISGVNLPNLFVLTYIDEQEQFYINVFNKGLIFNRRDIESYIEQLNLDKKETFFESCSNLDIIKRFLRNLIVSYDKNGQEDKKEEVRNLLLMIND